MLFLGFGRSLKGGDVECNNFYFLIIYRLFELLDNFQDCDAPVLLLNSV